MIIFKTLKDDCIYKKTVLLTPSILNRGVAQPGSAPALGAGSRRFKSSRPDQPSLLNGVKKRRLPRWSQRRKWATTTMSYQSYGSARQSSLYSFGSACLILRWNSITLTSCSLKKNRKGFTPGSLKTLNHAWNRTISGIIPILLDIDPGESKLLLLFQIAKKLSILKFTLKALPEERLQRKGFNVFPFSDELLLLVTFM